MLFTLLVSGLFFPRLLLLSFLRRFFSKKRPAGGIFAAGETKSVPKKRDADSAVPPEFARCGRTRSLNAGNVTDYGAAARFALRRRDGACALARLSPVRLGDDLRRRRLRAHTFRALSKKSRFAYSFPSMPFQYQMVFYHTAPRLSSEKAQNVAAIASAARPGKTNADGESEPERGGNAEPERGGNTKSPRRSEGCG